MTVTTSLYAQMIYGRTNVIFTNNKNSLLKIKIFTSDKTDEN